MNLRMLQLTRFRNIRGLRPFRALHDLKLYRISFLQRPVAITDDSRIMHEDIRTVFTADESVSFGIIEPFHSSLHFVSPW